MDVAKIIERVAELSLSGSVEGDTVGTAMILGWVQSTYEEVYAKIASQYPTLLETTQDVSVVSGQGTLNPVPHKIARVTDLTNKRELIVTTAAEVECKDLELDDEGAPTEYYITNGSKLNTYRKATISARVRFTPMCNVLEASGLATTIKFPEQFHDCLVWGALRFAAYDERDKGVGVELGVTQTMFDNRVNALEEWLRINQPKPVTRVKAFLP